MSRKHFSFFEFSPKNQPFPIAYAKDAIKKAKKKVGTIHGVVLPECALLEKDVVRLEAALIDQGVEFIIAGVRGEKKNYAHLGLRSPGDKKAKGKFSRYIQHKHHRWLLDKNQIHNYHLGSALHPTRKYWESMKIEPRKVNFACINGWLTMCNLICEDLARHDPVTQVIRAVGPNLVVALLLDGPQLEKRWPGRYASVLADDPGSSVLTVTSLGMALRSRPDGHSASRVIALWRDSQGVSREITLDSGKRAAVLTLCAHWNKEWTADGRHDEGSASSLVLSGVECV